MLKLYINTNQIFQQLRVSVPRLFTFRIDEILLSKVENRTIQICMLAQPYGDRVRWF